MGCHLRKLLTFLVHTFVKIKRGATVQVISIAAPEIDDPRLILCFRCYLTLSITLRLQVRLYKFFLKCLNINGTVFEAVGALDHLEHVVDPALRLAAPVEELLH